jgi:hypothetical protein
VLEAYATGFEGEMEDKTREPLFDLFVFGSLGMNIVGGFLLTTGVTLVLPLIQRSYTYEDVDADDGELLRTWQLAIRAEIGLGYKF